MKQVRQQIRDSSQLDEIFEHANPVDVYHSNAYYCNLKGQFQ